MFYTARKYRAMAAASAQWPTVEGRVLESTIKEIVRRSRQSTSTNYLPVVRYEYVVGGRRHEGDVITFGMTEIGFRKNAERYIIDRPVGATVTVHYDPGEPATATLDTSSAMADWRYKSGWIAIGIGVAVIVVVFFIVQYAAGT
jgi:hypothetical protein